MMHRLLFSFPALWFGSTALAEPPHAARFVVDLSPDDLERFEPSHLDDWLEQAAGASHESATHVEVFVRLDDGTVQPAEHLLPRAQMVPESTATMPPPPSGPAVDHPGASTGALSGKTVYISQCHGWIWFDTLGRFSTQRGNVFNTVEDFHNPEGADAFLIRYLENAGAKVVTLRERDHNPQMVIVDNGESAYSEVGTGFEDGPTGFAPSSTWTYGTNPFTSGSSRRFPADGGGVARFAPEVPTAGEYSVYVSYSAAASNDPAAHVRITHPGGTIDRTVDQTVHGSTWVYLDTLWLDDRPDSLTVEWVGDGTPGTWLSADAVRIGGGMGDVERYGDRTNRPRWEEGAVLYTQWNGAPTEVYDPYDSLDGSDPSARSRYAAWRSPPGEDAVYLSWHSNAGGGVGTSTYTYEGSSGASVTGSTDLGARVQDELVSAFRALWVSDWTDRGTRTAAFSEVSPYHNPDMPAALVELAFHDSDFDVEYLKEPEFRRDASRAMARGIVRYFADRDGISADFLPEPPSAVSVVHEGGDLLVRWTDGPAGDPFGDPPTSWTVYTSTDGRSWDNGTPTNERSLVLDLAPGETRFVRVSASNAGGESFPSEVLGARRMPEGIPPVLVVAAYDRLDSGQLTWEDVPVLGELQRMTDLRRLNAFNAVARQGRAIHAANWYFDSTSDDLLSTIELAQYQAVIWLAGEESTEDESFNDTQQTLLRGYWEAGGTLWTSGSEVLWDLDYRGTESDRAFAVEVLGATMADDDAATDSAVGVGLLEGLLLEYGESAGSPSPIEYPDVLASERTVLAEYRADAPAAVLGEGVAHFGFPVDAIGDETVRTEVTARVLGALLPDWEAPILDVGSDGDPDGDEDTGVPGVTPNFANGQGPGEPQPISKLQGCACSTGRASPHRLWVWIGCLAMWGISRRRRQSG